MKSPFGRLLLEIQCFSFRCPTSANVCSGCANVPVLDSRTVVVLNSLVFVVGVEPVKQFNNSTKSMTTCVFRDHSTFAKQVPGSLRRGTPQGIRIKK